MITNVNSNSQISMLSDRNESKNNSLENIVNSAVQEKFSLIRKKPSSLKTKIESFFWYILPSSLGGIEKDGLPLACIPKLIGNLEFSSISFVPCYLRSISLTYCKLASISRRYQGTKSNRQNPKFPINSGIEIMIKITLKY